MSRAAPPPSPDPADFAAEPFAAKLAHFGTLLGQFWLTPTARWSWAMLIVLVGVRFAAVYIGYLGTAWEKDLFDTLQFRDGSRLPSLFVMFGVIAASDLALFAIRGYFDDAISFNWRNALTDRYTARWLTGGAYHRIERRGLIDNPDQRITEDLSLFSTMTLQFATNLIGFTTGLFTYGILLWKMSGTLDFEVAGIQVSIAGYLVWAAVIYAVIGTWGITLVGRRLVTLNIRQQHFEADFRCGLIHVRRGAEQIAFYRGEEYEGHSLIGRFLRIRVNFFRRLRSQIGVAVTQNFYSKLSGFLPIFLVMPRFLLGGMTLGDVMQTRGLFGNLSGTLSFFMQSYQAIQELRATVRRIRAFDHEIDRPTDVGIRLRAGDGGLSVRSLELARPDGERLLRIEDWRVGRGERWIVRGASGVGKSTLLRSLAGIWTAGSGEVVAATGRTMFVPQMPYLPIGSLYAALRFPLEANVIPHDDYLAVLERCGLACHAEHLDRVDEWDRILSPGEQQRVALARILLNKPDQLFIDEATSALDPAGAAHFYRLLLEHLPGLTLVSVAHADGLDGFHTHVLSIEDGVATARPLPRHDEGASC